jgi:hypothetical protein
MASLVGSLAARAGAEPPPGSPAPSTAPPAAAPSTASTTAGTPAWTDPAPTPTFASDPIGTLVEEGNLTLKMYGDVGASIRDHTDQYINFNSANSSVYEPNVWHTFYAPRLDMFGSADVGKLSFLTEVMFEAANNNYTSDVERLQLAYLFKNWLRATVGRKHLAFGYYNDTYHHGNLFELTAARPFSVQFEDSFGLLLSHNVGVSLDGTLDAGDAGSFRYDLEAGNGRGADITAVDMQYAEKNDVMVNARLRWMPVDGLIFGVNGMRDVVPTLASQTPGAPARPETEELVAGAHVVYMEHDFHVDIEGFLMHHNPAGLSCSSISGGFAELGYTLGPFTPYVRGEYVRFPSGGDLVYQYTASSPEGQIVNGASMYAGTTDFTDLRVGVRWMPLPQVALKLEVERIGKDSRDQEAATVKVAFGF